MDPFKFEVTTCFSWLLGYFHFVFLCHESVATLCPQLTPSFIYFLFISSALKFAPMFCPDPSPQLYFLFLFCLFEIRSSVLGVASANRGK